jgi:hypothetical protein
MPVGGYKSSWSEVIKWLIEDMKRLENAMIKPLEKFCQELRQVDLRGEAPQ